MNETIAIQYLGRKYAATRIGETGVQVCSPNHFALVSSEEGARLWFGDHSLKKSKARKLLAAALRGEGELADPKHPLRVKPHDPHGKP